MCKAMWAANLLENALDPRDDFMAGRVCRLVEIDDTIEYVFFDWAIVWRMAVS